MPPPKMTASKVEYGDFQTPRSLADRVCAVLASRGLRPAAVLEPTCGTGAFMGAACRAFPSAKRMLGFDINSQHLTVAREVLRECRPTAEMDLRTADFFQTDWDAVLAQLPTPLLVLGNPPWVTVAGLTRVQGANRPRKSNVHGHRGLDALTGRGNFDIAEAILIRAVEWVEGRVASMAFLCKTSVVRRVLRYAWQRGALLKDAEIRRVNAGKHFGASSRRVSVQRGRIPKLERSRMLGLWQPRGGGSVVALRNSRRGACR